MTGVGVPSVLLLTEAVEGILGANENLTVYTSVVDDEPPADADGRAFGYAVIHPFAGDAASSNLAAQPGGLLWQFQVSCAGDRVAYVLWAVDTVRGLLDGKRLVSPEMTAGIIQPPPGFQAPPPRPVPLASGQRFQVPLLYQVLAVSAPEPA